MYKESYKDRLEAGHILAGLLREYKNLDGVVIAVPRGGVPVAYVIAQELGLPMELVLTKKIGHPHNKEYAIGAVSLQGSFITPNENVPEYYIKQETERIREGLRDMQSKYTNAKDPVQLDNKILILIDDGLATGNTLLTTISILKQSNPKQIIVAIPVASFEGIRKLSIGADKIYCPFVPDQFTSIGAYYENFAQVTDEEVIEYLNKLYVNNEANVAK